MTEKDDSLAEIEAKLAAREAKIEAIRQAAQDASDAARGPDGEAMRDGVDAAPLSSFDAPIQAGRQHFGGHR